MAEYTLQAEPPLAGTKMEIAGVRLWAPADLALVSLALPLGREDAADRAIKSAYGVDLPEIGRSVLAEDDTRLIRLAPDLAFALFTHATPDAGRVVAQRLNDALYTTDQTDVWVALALSGPDARRALERICPIDLHPQVFGLGHAARTVMEHLGVLILRTGEDDYLLLSASSSAKSFLHAVEVSLHNIA
ncbi:sarcosine oxidase, gamma subunit family [Roseovarius sp. A-2]|uniref:sarcosine oxidase subunit gamma n=1 Tax=Roseovarius sp. A-2 TaxID=1570360 RepID=UPI0009CB0EE7|nr:sarcosine oxidase subunit gamma family protein [Roseovarius sp. A-2]GAW35780.1 sarcosine oxidase, gamma subunit family [Roseovarius sp. A-2]